MIQPGSMLVIVLVIAVPCVSSAGPRKAGPGSEKACKTKLNVARAYADVGDWKDAEISFSDATKDPTCQKDAISGIQSVHAQQASDFIRTAQLYEAESEWSKAEDLYKAVSNDPSVGYSMRTIATKRLALILKKQAEEKSWDDLRTSITDWVEFGAKVAVFLLALVLAGFTLHSINKSRGRILIYPFSAPTEEVTKALAIHLRYARTTMNNPALSGAGHVPLFLVKNLAFSEDVDPIEDLEIAGSKIPFTSLAKLFGTPKVRVTGGFDAVGPTGNAYCVIQSKGEMQDTVVRRDIRIGVPNEQRLDLLDFAYDVMVKASTA